MAVAHNTLEIFDSKGCMLPMDQIEPQLAALDQPTRERFAAVQTAATEAAAATEGVRLTNLAVTDGLRALKTADEYLRTVRPPVTAHDAYRAWLSSQ